MTRPWPTISSIDCRDEEEVVGVWPATGGASRMASRNAPAFSFHAALIYDLTRPRSPTALDGLNQTPIDTNQANETDARFYGKFTQTQMSNRKCKGEKL